MSISRTKAFNIKWSVVIILPLLIFLVPESGEFSFQLKIFSVLTLAAILLFAFELLPNFITALVLPIVYILIKLAEPSVVFSPWLGTIPWMFIGGYLFANILIRIGLLKRVAYWIINKTGNTYNGLLVGITISGLAINIIAPGKAILPMAGLTFGICQALNLKKSKESAGIMLAGFFAAYIPLQFIYNPSFAVIPNMAASITSPSISFTQYFYHNLPFIAWIPIVIFMLSKITNVKEFDFSKDFITNELIEMGPISKEEIKAIFVSALLMVYLLTSNMHKMDMAWGFLLAGCLLYFPGFDVGKKEDISKVDFSMIVFTATCLSIGAVANSLGFGKIIAQLALPMVNTSNGFIVLGLFWGICVIANFLLTPMAIYATFTLALTSIGLQMGMNPFAIFYTIQAGGAEVLFPYQWALPLFYVSFGMISTKDFSKIFGIKMLLNLVYMFVVVFPYWKLIGLI